MNIASSAESVNPIKVGATIPNSPLVTMEGKAVQLHDVLGSKASILIFYRGSW